MAEIRRCMRVGWLALSVGFFLPPLFLSAQETRAADHRRLLHFVDADGTLAPLGSPEGWERRRRQILAGMEAAMGSLPSPKGPLFPGIDEQERFEGDRYTRHRISFQVDVGDRVPAYLYVPRGVSPDRGYPAMLALHPTSHLGKGVPAGLSRRPNRAYALELARRGYVVLAPDYPSFGDYPYDFESDDYVSGTMKGVVNHMRGIDLLRNRDDVDRDRIGVIGHSLGGHNAMFVAAFDPRIKAVVSSCGWTPFHDYYGGKIAGWTSARYMPRLRDVYALDPARVPFDFYEVIAALAPRGFFSCSPLGDDNFDVRGVRKAEIEARKVYALLGAPDRLRVAYPDAGHDFPLAERLASYRWLDQLFSHTPPAHSRGGAADESGPGIPGLRAGLAEVEITPPHAFRLSGYFHERLSTGTHDPLLAKALYLETGGVEVVMVLCDLSAVSLGLSSVVRDLAARRTGVPREHIVVGATHSHTGPLYFGALRDQFHAAAMARHGSDPHEVVDYVPFAARRIVDAIERARGLAGNTSLRVGEADEEGLTFHRRFYMNDGRVRFNPGKGNPNIERPAGPTDPTVQVVSLADSSGRPLAALTRFALHLDTLGGTLFSADFPYWMEKDLRAAFGGAFVSVFAPGTCGNLNHIDVSHDRRQKGPEEAERIGQRLARRVRDVIAESPAAHPMLAARSRQVRVPLQPYTPPELALALESMERIGSPELPFLERVNAYRIVSLFRRGGSDVALEVQVFRLTADAAIVALPGEIFVELGLAIREASPFKVTIVIELCNDAPGYIPTRQAFRDGGYETVNSRVRSGSGEVLVETALELLKELKAAP